MGETIRRVASGNRYLLVGGATGLAAAGAVVLIVVMVGSTLPFGLLLLPVVMAMDRAIAAVERRRAAATLGIVIPTWYPPSPPRPDRLTVRRWLRRQLDVTGALMIHPTTYRDAAWVLVHGVVGVGLAVITVASWGCLILTVSLPLCWTLRAPPGVDWPWLLLGVPVAITSIVWTAPLLAMGEARLAATMLAPPASHRLALRVDELARSRAEALDAHAAELRRIERALHDGVQAQLVSVGLLLGTAERRLRDNPAVMPDLIEQARQGAEAALAELRGTVLEMYPPILADRGLDGAIMALAGRSPVPVAVEICCDDRLPAAVETAAYFMIAEALTNVARHSHARRAVVRVVRDRRTLAIEITDDGIGGADEAHGSGLVGIRQRVGAFDGRMELHSPTGGPTVLRLELPCAS